MRHGPDKEQDVIPWATRIFKERVGFVQKLAVLFLVEHVPEMLVRCICLQMDILDVLTVRFVQGHRGGLYEVHLTVFARV